MKKYLIIFLLLVFCITKSKAQTDSLPDLPQLVVKDTTMIAFIKSSIKYFKKEDKYWKDYYYIEIDLSPWEFHPKNSLITLAYATYGIAPLGAYHSQSFERDKADVIGYTFIDDIPVLFKRKTARIAGFRGDLFQFSPKSLKQLFDILKRKDTRDKDFKNDGNVIEGVYTISNFLYLTEDRKIKYQH